MKKEIKLNDKMSFNCFPGVPCFTQCCRDVNIILTPYDVLRLKQVLSIPSDEFLNKYTLIFYKEKKLLPIVMLKMDEKNKTCPFVSKQGCKIYDDRPWSCRMFPLEANENGTYRFIVNQDRCLGLKEKKEWLVSEWLAQQGVPEYDRMNKNFFELVSQLEKVEHKIENPRIQDMLFMSLYNLDKFRDFITTTSFFEKFEFSRKEIEKFISDDTELLMLGINWVKFGLFGEPKFKIRQKKGSEIA